MQKSFLNTTIAIAAISAMGALISPHAQAGPITIGTYGNWQNATPSNANCLNTDPTVSTAGATHSVNWGVAANGGSSTNCTPQSGYDFQGLATTGYTPSGLVAVGTFTHRNQPVFGPSIDGVQLNFALIANDGSGAQTISHVFDFVHDETDNGANPCPYNPNNSLGECSDRVTLDAGFTSSLTLNGLFYSLQVLGFSVDGGTTIATDFVTLEGSNNNASIYARLVQVGGDCDGSNCNPVPAPGLAWLTGVGLLFAGLRVRARSSQQ
jgi:hypothetical protein